jgi:hypothetical protein
MNTQNLRFWLVRRLLGTDKIDRAIGNAQNALYTNCLAYIANRLAADSERYASEYVSKLVSEFSPELLASAIHANASLTESQKAHLCAVLASPQASATYLR